MRTIKFRAWDSENKEMAGVVEIVFDQYGGMDVRTSRRMGINASALGPANLMQFTGLLDKNGKEIFEGDIVMVRSQYNEEDGTPAGIESPNRVEFRDGAFRCGFHDMILMSKVTTGSEGNWNMEVIGNIHENPELLK